MSGAGMSRLSPKTDWGGRSKHQGVKSAQLNSTRVARPRTCVLGLDERAQGGGISHPRVAKSRSGRTALPVELFNWLLRLAIAPHLVDRSRHPWRSMMASLAKRAGYAVWSIERLDDDRQ